MPSVAVFDANVLVSAIGWAGTPRRCIDSARDGVCHGATSEPLLDELTAALRTKLRFSDQQLLDTSQYLLTFLRFVRVEGIVRGVCTDPKDDMVLESAVIAGATHIVSGDRRHLLPLREFRGIMIVSPAEFMEIMNRETSGLS
jgi:uncharacterized protein